MVASGTRASTPASRPQSAKLAAPGPKAKDGQCEDKNASGCSRS